MDVKDNIRDVVMRRERQGKYMFIVVDGHDMADSRGRILEHRFVISEHLGRPLSDEEVVHHIDGNGLNNDLSNLKLMTNAEHRRIHGDFREYIYPQCGVIFSRAKRNARGKRTFCSRRCSARFYYSGKKNFPKKG